MTQIYSSLVVLFVLMFSSFGQQNWTDAKLDTKAREIQKRIIVIDTHVDVLLPTTDEYYYLMPGRQNRADIKRLKAGGIGAIAFAIAVSRGPRDAAGFAEARKEAYEKFAAIKQFLKDNPRDAELALTPDDIVHIHKAGKVAIIESFLNARSIGKDISGIDEFYKLGVRRFGLVHGGNNDWADSSRPDVSGQFENQGLSPLGRQAIERLNHLGMIIDVSQMTTAGLMQVLTLSKAPVIASHSSVRALVDRARNLSDAELDAIKTNGGVVCVTVWNGYIARIPPELPAKVREIRSKYGLPSEFPGVEFSSGEEVLSHDNVEAFDKEIVAVTPKATVKDMVDHIDYIVKRIGIDHVGVGSDFNHGSGIEGFNDESDAVNVTKELLRRGYTEKQIAKIWGGNFLRVWRDVEKVSKKLKGSTKPSVSARLRDRPLAAVDGYSNMAVQPTFLRLNFRRSSIVP